MAREDKSTSNIDILGFNWYPGHIAKAERELKEILKLADLIIEVRDARAPFSTAHRELRSWLGTKPSLVVLNKADMADPKRLTLAMQEIIESAKYVRDPFALNTKTQKGFNGSSFQQLEKAVFDYAKQMQVKMQAKGIKTYPLKVVIVGFPNVGKSTLINHLSKTRKAKVENKAGVTRQQRWIEMHGQGGILVKLLDTPGIIPPKLYSKDQALKLALSSCVSNKAFDHLLVANAALEIFSPEEIARMAKFYSIAKGLEDLDLISQLSQQRNMDMEHAAQIFISDIQSAAFGAMSFD